MPAPKGNQFWKARTKHGRDKIIQSAELLKVACEQYFEWVEDNPLEEAKLVSYEGQSKLESVPKMRAMTIGGLCLFLDITVETWTKWRSDDDKDFSDVTRWADEVIRDQKFTGASSNMLNANIIARDLGLKDLNETSHKGSVVIKNEPDLSSLTKEQLDALESLATAPTTGGSES